MIEKKLLQPNRVRHINGGFSFIPHRFLTDGFLSSLTQKEILLYFFLILPQIVAACPSTPMTSFAPFFKSALINISRPETASSGKI